MYRLDKVKADIRQETSALAIKKGKRDLLTTQRDEAVMRKLAAELDLDVYDKVQILLQKTSDYARQQVKSRIEDLVTSALSVVFDKGYKFWIQLDVRSNQPEADYFLESDGVTTQLKKPDYDRGGGVADVVSLALRLSIAELVGIEGPIFLDEVGKHVSSEFSPNVAFFLKNYSEKFNRQIILVTHNAHLAEIGDVSIGVTQKAGKSEVAII